MSRNVTEVTLFMNKGEAIGDFSMGSQIAGGHSLLFSPIFLAPSLHWLRYLEGADFPIHLLLVPLNMHTQTPTHPLYNIALY